MSYIKVVLDYFNILWDILTYFKPCVKIYLVYYAAMKTLTKKQSRILKNKYGNHTQAAKAIGIDPRYYRNLRSGKMKPGKLLMLRIKDLIL